MIGHLSYDPAPVCYFLALHWCAVAERPRARRANAAAGRSALAPVSPAADAAHGPAWLERLAAPQPGGHAGGAGAHGVPSTTPRPCVWLGWAWRLLEETSAFFSCAVALARASREAAAAAAAAAELAYVARRLVLLVWQCWGEYTRHRRATRRADALHHRAARARGLRSMRRAVHASQLMGQVRGLMIDAPCPLFASHGASIRQVPSAASFVRWCVCCTHGNMQTRTSRGTAAQKTLTPQLRVAVRQRKRAAAAHRRQRTSELVVRLIRRALHPAATASSLDTHGPSITCRFWQAMAVGAWRWRARARRPHNRAAQRALLARRRVLMHGR
jgi:hypothetical protein